MYTYILLVVSKKYRGRIITIINCQLCKSQQFYNDTFGSFFMCKQQSFKILKWTPDISNSFHESSFFFPLEQITISNLKFMLVHQKCINKLLILREESYAQIMVRLKMFNFFSHNLRKILTSNLSWKPPNLILAFLYKI